MDLLKRYRKIKDELEMITCTGAGYDHDECHWDIQGYYEYYPEDEGVLRERVEALENLAKAIERVNNTQVIYA